MGDAESPGFGSLEEELDYWKDQAARNKHRSGPALVFRTLFTFDSEERCESLQNVVFLTEM